MSSSNGNWPPRPPSLFLPAVDLAPRRDVLLRSLGVARSGPGLCAREVQVRLTGIERKSAGEVSNGPLLLAEHLIRGSPLKIVLQVGFESDGHGEIFHRFGGISQGPPRGRPQSVRAVRFGVQRQRGSGVGN